MKSLQQYITESKDLPKGGVFKTKALTGHANGQAIITAVSGNEYTVDIKDAKSKPTDPADKKNFKIKKSEVSDYLVIESSFLNEEFL